MQLPQFQTLIDILKRSTSTFGSRELFGEKKNGQWVWTTYSRFGEMVDDLRGGLAQLGVGAGDRVAVISNNRLEWAVGAYATYSLGGAYVPMYESQQAKELQFIINDSGSKVVFCATDEIAQRIQSVRAELPHLEHIIRFSGTTSDTDSFATLLRRGAETPTPMVSPKPTDLAGLIYTSGTTGQPKGVMLSHANIARNVSAMHEVFPMGTDDRSLAFLPWAHVFGQTVELHALFSMGASMAIAEAVEKIIDNLSEVKPTLLFSVPRIFNRIYDGLQKRMAGEKPVTRFMFRRGLAVAAEKRALAEQGKSSGLLDLQHAFFDKVVFSKVRARFGGRLKYAFSGGSAISKEVAEFIDNLGITVYEGYGLTETSPIATANFPENRKIGSVGKALPGVRIEIDTAATGEAKQGEIVVHGHNVMMGYYNKPEENEKVFTGNGGFRTGDMGYLDPDGYLYITGRIKEQYKLENGKYVVPSPIEQSLALSTYIANALVHGMNKPYNVAIIVVDVDALKKWATEKGLDTSSMPELLKRPEVLQLYREQVNEFTRDVKGYERPQRFLLTSEDFTVANDMLTPKMSVKRRNVVARYNDAIEALYREGADRSVSAA
ncbi:AMP-dependent synthetase/ligase [Corallococcus macrosporus]|uniref:Putative long-chain-fatty-acid--CoA ligase n=1 Tax=Myxococcus fulvus (strain ATCC BAA-855 / HW-1) TaxID=483219 RepID=F8CD55_MYXFH|nr:long-chain fatty acid--CoA ligase [Corallococcus macrosporus]AEI65972.1 putative long-chain-fatty-acid--CoA ligase [Corallococcus macrosporus]